MTYAPDVAGTTPTTMPTAVLRTADHNRGLYDVLAIVEAMERPSDRATIYCGSRLARMSRPTTRPGHARM